MSTTKIAQKIDYDIALRQDAVKSYIEYRDQSIEAAVEIMQNIQKVSGKGATSYRLSVDAERMIDRMKDFIRFTDCLQSIYNEISELKRLADVLDEEGGN